MEFFVHKEGFHKNVVEDQEEEDITDHTNNFQFSNLATSFHQGSIRPHHHLIPTTTVVGGDQMREQMFHKIVTPSDVGKLNRLVIPKQHAEKYFPLNSASNEKAGLLLNFEDRTGKSWRFRYSYWTSSQSYVMTRGWSRFVKDKHLVSGDIVSFHRSVAESGDHHLHLHRLFIDWRHSPNQQPLQLARVILPPLTSLSSHFHPCYRFGSSVSHRIGTVYDASVVANSEAVAGKSSTQTPSKRLRLFGVNMECPIPDQSG